MSENSVATITITIDEYFDLRQKAEANAYLMTELARLDYRLEDVNKRLFEMEEKYRRG